MQISPIFHIVATIAYPAIDPVLFRLGPLSIRWYGLAYVLGFILAYAGMRMMIRSGRLHISYPQLSDLLGWLVLGVVAGGRIGWWFFYDRSMDMEDHWFEPFAIWRGGMSFHGGVMGVALVLAIWSWCQRAAFWDIADALSLVAPIGLFLGRIANFINAELVGRPTSMPWGIIFPGDAVARHPSQLYEAMLEGPLLLLVLWTVARRRDLRDGRVTAAFLVFYAAGRFAVEFTRQPDTQLGFIAFGWLTMGQLLSVLLATVGAVLWLVHPTRKTEFIEPSQPCQTF